MSDERWKLTLQDPDDPYGHSARAVQRDKRHWDVEYYRGDELDSTGSISTPPPYMPPMATLMSTLQDLRQVADYWARQPSNAAVPKEGL
ncbi:hypothetical protein ACWEF6_02750 [Amycolatopsis sp. NPDC004772]